MRSLKPNPKLPGKVAANRRPSAGYSSANAETGGLLQEEGTDPAPQLTKAKEELQLAARELARERDKRIALERDLENAKRQVENSINDLEEAFGRANQMTLKAEIANIELNQIFNSSADGMWVIDRDFRVLKINETLLNLLRRSRGDAVGGKCFELFRGPSCHTPDCFLTRLARGETSKELDQELDLADGGKRFFLVSAVPFLGLDGQLVGIVEDFRDITDRKLAEAALQRANEELQRMATVDGLTQISNRRRFDEGLLSEWKRMARERKPLSLVLCDIDYFKRYNDTYGHQSGDDCLRMVAQCLRQQAKRPSDLAARYGGEEFVVLLPDTDLEGAFLVAESVRTKVAELKIEHSGSAVAPHVTISLGVATFLPGPGLSVEAMVGAADRALYEAKRQGRNRVVSL